MCAVVICCLTARPVSTCTVRLKVLEGWTLQQMVAGQMAARALTKESCGRCTGAFHSALFVQCSSASSVSASVVFQGFQGPGAGVDGGWADGSVGAEQRVQPICWRIARCTDCLVLECKLCQYFRSASEGC